MRPPLPRKIWPAGPPPPAADGSAEDKNVEPRKERESDKKSVRRWLPRSRWKAVLSSGWEPTPDHCPQRIVHRPPTGPRTAKPAHCAFFHWSLSNTIRTVWRPLTVAML